MKKSHYGTMPDGTPVAAFDLENGTGMQIRIIEYGATTTDLWVPDRDGFRRNVVLGYASLEAYRAGRMWFGATAGRVAGRITNATFTLDGTRYDLDANDAPNCLHGGSNALDSRVWMGTEVESADGECVEFRTTSADGENGFPGNLTVTARFTLLAGENTLRMEYRAATDAPTPVNLINHAYLNLDGDEGDTVDGQFVQVDADEYTPAGEGMTLLGTVLPVEDTPADLRSPRPVGEVVPGLFNRHGDNYRLRRAPGDRRLIPAAAAYSPESGITLEITTTTDCVQFFGGEYIAPDPPGRTGCPYPPRAGFCLECQDYPDGANHPEISDLIATPARPYDQRTEWRFGVRSHAIIDHAHSAGR
jgi:aldose 1-epimerase